MTNTELKFIQLAKQREEVISKLKELNEALEPVMEELGNGAIFQGSCGTVYKVREWAGQFVKPKNLEYIRTRNVELGDPKAGGVFLSKKEATENGFSI